MTSKYMLLDSNLKFPFEKPRYLTRNKSELDKNISLNHIRIQVRQNNFCGHITRPEPKNFIWKRKMKFDLNPTKAFLWAISQSEQDKIANQTKPKTSIKKKKRKYEIWLELNLNQTKIVQRFITGSLRQNKFRMHVTRLELQNSILKKLEIWREPHLNPTKIFQWTLTLSEQDKIFSVYLLPEPKKLVNNNGQFKRI